MDASTRSRRGAAKSLPLDLSHHYSFITKNRLPSKMKDYYKYFQIPGIGNLAGGLPNVRYFPFDTLEAQAAKPERWEPSPEQPDDGSPGVYVYDEDEPSYLAARLASSKLSSKSGSHKNDVPDVGAAHHVTVPKVTSEADPLKKIDLATALQYGTAEGYPPLRSFIRQFTRDHLHPNVPYLGGPEVILTCGSTDGFGKTIELLVDPWDPAKDPIESRPALLCEVFVYTNILAQSMPKGVQPVTVEIDDQGMLAYGPGGLQEVMETWDVRNGRRPHFMYTVTMGHNPTGGLLSVERRKEIYAICSKYDVIIVEDDPYWYLQYPSAAVAEARSRNQPIPAATPAPALAGDQKSSGYPFLDSLVPSYLSIDTDGRVVRLDTFSKTIAPGCRLGWITAQPDFIERFMRITETSTQQPSGFVQSMVAEVVMGPQADATVQQFNKASAGEKLVFSGWKMDGWVRWLEGLRGEYERRMNRMCRLLDEGSFQLKQSTPIRPADQDWGVITKTPLFDFDWPRGGMFVWLRVHFERHPLWLARGRTLPLLDGFALTTALMTLCTHKPYLVLVAPGLMFSATDAVRADRGWAYYRLCFAAESDENIDRCSDAFGQAVKRFWKIKSVDEMEALATELGSSSASYGDIEAEEMGNLMGYMGC